MSRRLPLNYKYLKNNQVITCTLRTASGPRRSDGKRYMGKHRCKGCSFCTIKTYDSYEIPKPYR